MIVTDNRPFDRNDMSEVFQLAERRMIRLFPAYATRESSVEIIRERLIDGWVFFQAVESIQKVLQWEFFFQAALVLLLREYKGLPPLSTEGVRHYLMYQQQSTNWITEILCP